MMAKNTHQQRSFERIERTRHAGIDKAGFGLHLAVLG